MRDLENGLLVRAEGKPGTFKDDPLHALVALECRFNMKQHSGYGAASETVRATRQWGTWFRND